jgi:HPt (histidine-containing phosphotransfer) domain-containing protein
MATADLPEGARRLRVPPPPQACIDVDDALERIRGDTVLYAHMLIRFRHDCEDRGERAIRAAIGSGELELAKRLAHTLRGAASMIGAQALSRQAAVVESALRAAAAGIEAELDALGAALIQVGQAITLLLSEPMPDAVVSRRPAPSAVAATALLAQLDAMLVTGDGAAIDLIDTCAPSLRALLGAAESQALMRAVNEFDFEGALETLARCASRAREAGA